MSGVVPDVLGVVPAAATGGPPAWRLLTVADLGTPVGDVAQGVTISDSGDPEYPIRIVAASAAAAVATVCIPISGDAAAILDRAIVAAPIMRVKSTVGPPDLNFTGVGFGTFDGADVATAAAAGCFVQQQIGPRRLRVSRWAISNTTLNTSGGGIDYPDGDPDTSTHVYVHHVSSVAAGTTNRVVWSIVAGPDQDGSESNNQTGNAYTTVGRLTTGTRTWCLAARKGASTTTQTIDLALWIMATPPGAPFAPQP